MTEALPVTLIRNAFVSTIGLSLLRWQVASLCVGRRNRLQGTSNPKGEKGVLVSGCQLQLSILLYCLTLWQLPSALVKFHGRAGRMHARGEGPI